MNSFLSAFIPIIALLLILFYQKRESAAIRAIRIIKKRRRINMNDIIAKFQGKDCLVYTMNGSQISGTVKGIQDGWIEIDNGKETQAVNSDYIVRIREYPTDKKGKKKSVVFD